MKTIPLEYYSDGIRLEGMLQVPDDQPDGERRPAIIVCSGVQGLKEWVPSRWWPSFLARGYPVMAFDYRGFGTSDGERGRLIPEEEIRDVIASITCLQQQPQVDPDRIGLLGWGLGGGIVVSTAARDSRVVAAACVNGLGHAGRTVRDALHYRDWLELKKTLAADRVQRVMTGKSEPNHNLHYNYSTAPDETTQSTQFGKDMKEIGKQPVPGFTLESVEAYHNFRPEKEAAKISPRSLLIVHGDQNPFMPVDEALSLYEHAQEPKDLILIPGAEHLEWIVPGSPWQQPYMDRIVDWFAGKFGCEMSTQ